MVTFKYYVMECVCGNYMARPTTSRRLCQCVSIRHVCVSVRLADPVLGYSLNKRRLRVKMKAKVVFI